MSSSRSVYPSGFSTGITVRGLPLNVSHPGEVFFVNNSSVLAKGGVGGSNGNPGTYTKPFSTIEGALNHVSVRASRGDVIFCMPGHAETISSATALNMDKNGVALIGALKLSASKNRNIKTILITSNKNLAKSQNRATDADYTVIKDAKLAQNLAGVTKLSLSLNHS